MNILINKFAVLQYMFVDYYYYMADNTILDYTISANNGYPVVNFKCFVSVKPPTWYMIVHFAWVKLCQGAENSITF